MSSNKKKELIENNIKAIQERIEALEQSFQPEEDEIEEIQMEPSISKKHAFNPTFKINNEKPAFQRNEQKLKNNNFMKKSIKANNDRKIDSPQKEQRMVNDLLSELDEQKQIIDKQSSKIESLEFRCQKLQDELGLKIEELTELSSANEHISLLNKKAENHIQNLENQMDEIQGSSIPQIQKLKSQNEVILLEMSSIENDNKVLDERVVTLEKETLDLRQMNRELRNQNSKIETERLALRKEVEELKGKFYSFEDQVEDGEKKVAEVECENERLRNEVNFLRKKIVVLEEETEEFPIENKKIDNKIPASNSLNKEKSMRLANSRYVNDSRRNESIYGDNLESFNKINSKVPAPKLRIEPLEQIGERIKKLNNQ